MTDESEGAYDWPHAVGAESKAELIAEIGHLHECLKRRHEELARLRGLLEAAQSCFRHYVKGGYLPHLSNAEAESWLAEYDKLKGE